MAHSHTQAAHGGLGGYVAGFILAVLLTAGSFGLVLHGALPPSTMMFALGALAFVQIVVHLVFFLHMSPGSGQGWNLLALAYTVLAALVVVFGTMWVMNNVGALMMSR